MRFFWMGWFSLGLAGLTAQDNFKVGTRFGAKVGIAASQLSGDNNPGFHKTGFTGGAYLRLRLSKRLLTQIELLFVQKGNEQIIGSKGPSERKNMINLWYTEFPLLLQFAYKKWTLETGPGFGFLLMQEETDLTQGYIYSGQHTPFKSHELNWNAGLQYAFTTFFAINLRYSNSVWPVRQLSTHSGRLHGQQLNNVLALTFCGRVKTKQEKNSTASGRSENRARLTAPQKPSRWFFKQFFPIFSYAFALKALKNDLRFFYECNRHFQVLWKN